MAAPAAVASPWTRFENEHYAKPMLQFALQLLRAVGEPKYGNLAR